MIFIVAVKLLVKFYNSYALNSFKKVSAISQLLDQATVLVEETGLKIE